MSGCDFFIVFFLSVDCWFSCIQAMNCDDFSKNGSSSGLTKLFIKQNNLVGNGQLVHLNSIVKVPC